MPNSNSGTGASLSGETGFIVSTEVMLLLLAVCTFAACVHLYQFASQRLARWSMVRKHGCLPGAKYPHRTDTGLDLDFDTQEELAAGTWLASQKARFDRHGPTFETHLDEQRTIHTIEPRNIEVWAMAAFENFGRADVTKALGKEVWGKGVLTQDGRPWAHSRALMRPTFRKDNVAQLDMFRPHVDRLLALLRAKQGETVDLSRYFRNYICDTETEFLFGESAHCQDPASANEAAQDFLCAFEDSSESIGSNHITGRIAWKIDKNRKQNITMMNAYVDKQVAKALALCKELKEKPAEKPPSRIVLLQEMAGLTEEDDEPELRSQILQILLPGHESTSGLLSAVMFALAAHPEAWEKVRKEVQSNDFDEPSYETIKRCTYLRCTLNEALRLWPLFPLDRRMCLKDTVLPLGGGPEQKAPLLVTHGTICIANTYALHRSKAIWGEDAEEFKPERWFKARPTWEYQGFGGGARICPAQGMALTEAGYVLYRLVKTFGKLESKDKQPWKESMKLSVRNKHGVKVALGI